MAFVQVAKDSDVKEGGMKVVKANGQAIVLTRLQGTVRAFTNTCPHLHGPLGEGDMEKGIVTCPLHGAKFDVRTGANVAPTFGGQAVSPIKTFAVKVENGSVLVDA